MSLMQSIVDHLSRNESTYIFRLLLRGLSHLQK
jgi:hypothetical protein